MLPLQLSPPSFSSFPRLLSPAAAARSLRRRSMSTTTSQPSVFNALGSYADRIKDANGKLVPAGEINGSLTADPTPGSSKSPAPSPRPPAAKLPKAETSRPQRHTPSNETKPNGTTSPVEEEDGSWEKVTTKQRSASRHHEEKKSSANASKNWRERPPKDDKAPRASGSQDDEKKGKGKKGEKSGSGTASTSTSATKAESSGSSEKPAVTKAPISTSTKPAWGLATPAASTSQARTSPSTTPQAAQVSAKPGQSTPPSQEKSSVETPATRSSASPAPSGDTASSTTAATSVTTKIDAEDEGSWRARSKEESSTPQAEAPQPSAPKIAPAPTVNPWDARKKALGVTPSPSAPANLGPKPGQAGPAAQSTSTVPMPNGVSKPEDVAKDAPTTGKKKKKAGEAPPVDAAQWPDVMQAAEVIKKEEGKKEKLKEKKTDDEANGQDEAAATSKKTKWTPIPAQEMQAAADERAEQLRKSAAARKRVPKAEASTSPAKGKPTRKASVERPAGGKQVNGERSQGPPPTRSRTAGSVRAASEAGDAQDDTKDVPNFGGNSLSRQTSRQSMRGGMRSSVPPSPNHGGLNLEGDVNGTIPESRALEATSSAPLPQSAFPGPHGLPRPPRGRDGRGSFSDRGRARGFRGGHHGKGFTSPILGSNGLPVDPNYARGYGGYQPFHPNGGNKFAAMSNHAHMGYDPAAAPYPFANAGPPPPPQPQTLVPNIDPLRFYVLGQVEYYFSMQNLAMDFFLRQQMDSEGWIDITMIASFNRLKSLTPDIGIIKEVMALSALLEVREEKVRLSSGESKKWVLPDAKPSTLPPDAASQDTPARSTTSHDDENTAADMALAIHGLGIESGIPQYALSGVETALMKSVPPSSSASVLNGEGEGEDEGGDKEMTTPGTSMSGDVAEAEEKEA